MVCACGTQKIIVTYNQNLAGQTYYIYFFKLLSKKTRISVDLFIRLNISM